MTDGGRRSALAAQKNVPQLEETCKKKRVQDICAL